MKGEVIAWWVGRALAPPTIRFHKRFRSYDHRNTISVQQNQEAHSDGFLEEIYHKQRWTENITIPCASDPEILLHDPVDYRLGVPRLRALPLETLRQ
jgi:hypothetical protein